MVLKLLCFSQKVCTLPASRLFWHVACSFCGKQASPVQYCNVLQDMHHQYCNVLHAFCSFFNYRYLFGKRRIGWIQFEIAIFFINNNIFSFITVVHLIFGIEGDECGGCCNDGQPRRPETQWPARPEAAGMAAAAPPPSTADQSHILRDDSTDSCGCPPTCHHISSSSPLGIL